MKADCKPDSSIHQDLEINEEYGPLVAEDVAEVLQRLASKQVSNDELKEKMGLISTNKLPPLTHVKVTEEVWRKIISETRSTDMHMEKIKMKAVKSLAHLAYIIDSCSVRKEGTSPTSSEGYCDGFAAIFHLMCLCLAGDTF